MQSVTQPMMRRLLQSVSASLRMFFWRSINDDGAMLGFEIFKSSNKEEERHAREQINPQRMHVTLATSGEKIIR